MMSSKVAQQEEILSALREEAKKNTIGSRMKIIVLAMTPDKRRFPTLEDKTGVPENTWRTWWTKGTVPSGNLVAAIGTAWPEFAFWLTTGITDVEYGHRMPPLHPVVQGYVFNYPEGKLKKDRLYAAEYFKVCLELQTATTDHHRSEILKNMRIFIMEKRREEVAKGVIYAQFTSDEA